MRSLLNDLYGEIQSVMAQGLAVDHYAALKQALEGAGKVLYLGDNAGETVFDRLLIETFKKKTVYVVRDIPIINDATVTDAEESGLNQVAQVISSGCDAPGTILKRCSREFLDLFASAEVIISKGQGNFESLSGQKAPIFYLFKVKCPVIARHVGVGEGEMILAR